VHWLDNKVFGIHARCNQEDSQKSLHGSRIFPYGGTDEQRDMTKLMAAFRNFANATKTTWKQRFSMSLVQCKRTQKKTRLEFSKCSHPVINFTFLYQQNCAPLSITKPSNWYMRLKCTFSTVTSLTVIWLQNTTCINRIPTPQRTEMGVLDLWPIWILGHGDADNVLNPSKPSGRFMYQKVRH